MCTSSSSLAARLRASFLSISRWRSKVSVICVPIVSVGFKLVIGSWKIIAISRPRTSSSWRSERFARSRPANSTEPFTILAGGGIRPMIERAVTDLPHPDSPTIPSVRPLSTEKEMPSTARTTPCRVKKCVLRSRTSRSGTPLLALLRHTGARIERVTKAIGDEERAEDEPGDREAGKDDQVWMGLIGGIAVLRERAPGSLRWIDAEPDERQEGLAEDHSRQLEEHEHDHDPERVRQPMAQEDPLPARADPAA